jgi:hypothetical protein
MIKKIFKIIAVCMFSIFVQGFFILAIIFSIFSIFRLADLQNHGLIAQGHIYKRSVSFYSGNFTYYYKFKINNQEFKGSYYCTPIFKPKSIENDILYKLSNPKNNCIKKYIKLEIILFSFVLTLEIVVIALLILFPKFRTMYINKFFKLKTNDNQYNEI